MTEEDILDLGFMLEEKGLSHSDIDTILEHHGVKGQKWGVRRAIKNTAKVQKRLERTNRIAEGTATLTDRLLGSALTKGGAKRQLQRGANQQAKINAGKLRVTNRLAKMQGVKISELNFHAKGDAKAGLDGGQKAALAFVGATLAARGAVALAKH